MAKEKTTYTCTECGGTSPRWLGKCPQCEAWNTLIETVPEQPVVGRNRFASLAKTSEVAMLSEIEASEVERQPT
ncbi:MAG TPA: DNA repair protein RadA, partial [Ramlibacter sp.]|nr:DNA repair protein RadA [Ramlibacter sp.]